MKDDKFSQNSKMELRDWCIEQIGFETSGKARSRQIQNVKEKLIRRMNVCLGNYYGNKSFIHLGNSNFMMEEIFEYCDAYENELKNENKKYVNLEDKIEKLKENQDINVDVKESKIATGEYKMKEYKNKAKRIIEKSYDFPFHFEKRFKTISLEDKRIFDFLINDEKYKVLHKKKYDVSYIKTCREFIDLLYAVADRPEWELEMAKLENIEVSLMFPGIGKLKDIYYFLNEQEEISEDRLKKINTIQKKIDQLYKEIQVEIDKMEENSSDMNMEDEKELEKIVKRVKNNNATQ